MSKDGKEAKPKYEAPAVVALGELAKGSGNCYSGSGDSGAYCSTGNIAAGTCTVGNGALGACGTGGSVYLV